MADVTVLYVNADGSLTQLQDGDNLLADNLNRKSASGNITIGGNVTGVSEDVVIGSALSATGEVLLGSVASQARVLGDFAVDGALGAALDAGDFAITNIGTSLELSNGAEIRFWDVGDSNYVGFEAPALTATQIWVLPATDSTGTQYLRSDGAGNLSWGTPAGSGDVTGPGTHGDNVLPRWNGVDTNVLQNTGITVSDTNVVDGLTRLDFSGATATGAYINFPDAGGDLLMGYGTGAPRRIMNLSSDGLTLRVGEDVGNVIPTLDLEASVTILFNIAGIQEMSLTATALDLEGNNLIDMAQITMTGATATSGSINLVNDGSIFSYGGGAERRLMEVTGSAVFLGQNAGTGTVTAFDIEASTNVDISIGAGDEVVLSVQGGLIQILEYGGTPTTLRFYDGDTTNYVALRAATAIGADVTWILPATDSTGTQYLRSDGAGNLSWGTPTGGSGDVTGPASSTDNVICRFSGATGKVIQGGGTDGVSDNPPTYDDSGNVVANPTGSTQSPVAPRTIGFSTFGAGQAGRFQLGDVANGLQTGIGACVQLYSYHTLQLLGDRQDATAPAFVAGTAEDIAVLVDNIVAGDIALVVRAHSTQTANLMEWQADAGTTLVAITGGGTVNLINHDLDNIKTATFNSEYAYAGGTTLDWNNGQKQGRTLTANTTITTFTNPPGPCNLVLRLKQAAAGGPYTITWPAAVQWPGGTDPTMSTTASRTDIFSFYFDGTTYYGVASKNFF